MSASPGTPSDPLWYKDAVIYQLHIKSFYDANGDGVGDFAGLLEKLDYLVQLGVDTVWLLPFYPSPRRDDGYDIADYRSVHPEYGTLAEVRHFIREAHARGLRVITELVINHTSDQHPWFQRARAARKGTSARNFYVWSDSDHAYAGTRIIFCDTEKSNWSWDPVAEQYYWHRFYAHQPDLNFDHPPVLRAVLSVMRFWLDMGVDGLRLDAVPYLVEREGTSNENLPETHAVIRRIRAALDADYHGRLLLAEANMWPEDAQQYFGGHDGSPAEDGAEGSTGHRKDDDSPGDECHMAFHFPLMPRMYMAIAREDRFPITDIMRQTPDIPSNCQWAIFLRNHDELTLEMVTSRERDYLWEVYATERRARINLGIRRRLSPLMERDRRRIELMNSLLFSMPGTPVLYYGDEIGMGDNIHLGDRDGVRTPMQWSPDRNGGFSRADPERLVLPPLQGPLYGFEAVNVEAQQRDPHSLLNWVRRMLALRRQHRAFGRGSLRFLYPRNRKILAYLRTYGDDHGEEHILCVANLSRVHQAVELDLAEFAGRVPVEMLGANSFPAIGQLTYLLTLPPYGFYWFVLSDTAEPPAWHVGPPEPMAEQITLVLRGTPLLNAHARDTLAREALPEYLRRRRWFSAKDGALDAVRVAYAVPFVDGVQHPCLLSEIDVQVAGRTLRYQLPLGLLWDADDSDSAPQLPGMLSLARARTGSRVGLVTDAFTLEAFARGVLQAFRTQRTIDTEDGQILFRAEADPAQLDAAGAETVAWVAAEQSNSSLSYGNVAILKLVRRITGGIHPEAEMTRYLTRHGYASCAQLLGEVVRVDPQGTPHTLMLLQSYLLNQGDGWQWTLDYLARTLDEVLPALESDEGCREALGGYVPIAAMLGQRLAQLHAVLAQPSDDPAFDPVPVTENDTHGWADTVVAAVDGALAQLAGSRFDDHPNAARMAEDIALLQALRPQLPASLRVLAAAAPGSLQTRVHGDFHLGQTLVVQNDVALVDFEGEPGKPLAERRRKTSPLRDVAGMLRSFDYAAATLGTHQEPLVAALPPALAQRRDALLTCFRSVATESFLNAYLETAAEAPHAWVTPEQFHALVDLFQLERAAYEVGYEAANREHWIDLPLAGLARLARKLTDVAEHDDV
ncbi:maltose alpha-D-glucosyltransferase [Imbroritus primus]|uniref:maltose alpha-D-glucosyltransferase n=1 Tax=Imbroritus primus TaxID=3058603 RepID=UPI003D1610E6